MRLKCRRSEKSREGASHSLQTDRPCAAAQSAGVICFRTSSVATPAAAPSGLPMYVLTCCSRQGVGRPSPLSCRPDCACACARERGRESMCGASVNVSWGACAVAEGGTAVTESH